MIKITILPGDSIRFDKICKMGKIIKICTL